MPSTMITVQAKQSPAIGKKQGKIQDTAGNLWNVWGDKLQNYREGVTYDIVYEESEFNGHTFNLIKTANPAQAKPPGSVTPVADPRQVIPRNDGWPGPQSTLAANPKDEMIFVCGVVNNAMSNTNINPFEITLTELIAMVDKARSAWRNTLGKSQKADDMNDQIPDFR